jgi:hypothetical protein
LHYADALSGYNALPQANGGGDWFVGGPQVSGVRDDQYGPVRDLSDKTDATDSRCIDQAVRSHA